MDNNQQPTDQAKFDAVCEREASFHGNPLGRMFQMHNQVSRTVGDGTIDDAEWGAIQVRLAEKAGPEGSKEYEAALTKMNKQYQDAKDGKSV